MRENVYNLLNCFADETNNENSDEKYYENDKIIVEIFISLRYNVNYKRQSKRCFI